MLKIAIGLSLVGLGIGLFLWDLRRIKKDAKDPLLAKLSILRFVLNWSSIYTFGPILIGVGLLLSAAFAEAAENFCEDPMATVCNGISPRRPAPQFGSEFREKAIRAAVAQLGVKRDASLYKRFWTVNEALNNPNELEKLNRERSPLVIAYFGALEKLGLRISGSTVKGIKNELLRAIDREENLSPQLKKTMREKVISIELIQPSKAVEKTIFTVATITCGPDGMGVNGTLVQTSPEKLGVMLCPGLLVMGLDVDGKDSVPVSHVDSSLLFAIAHELGHSIDSAQKGFEAAYGDEKSCLFKLKDEPGDPKFKPELVADYWGARVLYTAIEKKTQNEAMKAVKRNIGYLCASQNTSRGHPPGVKRIAHLAMTITALRDKFGCKAANAACVQRWSK